MPKKGGCDESRAWVAEQSRVGSLAGEARVIGVQEIGDSFAASARDWYRGEYSADVQTTRGVPRVARMIAAADFCE